MAPPIDRDWPTTSPEPTGSPRGANQSWLQLAEKQLVYHRRQFATVNRSTVAFCDWLSELGLLGSSTERMRVLDVACGMGANVAYMAKRFSADTWEGFDLHSGLIAEGRKLIAQQGLTNAKIRVANLFEPSEQDLKAFDGVTFFQTLLNMDDLGTALDRLLELTTDWIAFSTLVYDGPVSVKMMVTDHANDRETGGENHHTYQIYPWERLEFELKSRGMRRTWYTPFELDIDLPKQPHLGLGTYTEQLIDGRRLQISGPLLMPWSFVAASRESPDSL